MRFSLRLVSLGLILFGSVGNAFAQTRVVVLPFNDRTKQIDSRSITEKMRIAINRTPGYWTYPSDTFESNIRRYGLRSDQLYDVKYQKQVADLMKVDYFVEGSVTMAQKFVLQVGLREAKSSAMLISRQYAFGGNFTQQLADLATKDLLSKATRSNVVKDAGAAAGAGGAAAGSRAAPVSSAPPEQQRMPAPKSTPVPTAAKSGSSGTFVEPREEARGDSFVSDRMRVMAGLKLLKNDYSLVRSDGVTAIDSSGSYFVNVGVNGEYWIVPYAGVQFDFSLGFISLDVPSGPGTTSNADAKLWQLGGDAVGRYPVRLGDRDLELRGFGGYRYLKYDIGDQPILSDDKYSGLAIGVGAQVPVYAPKKRNEAGIKVGGSYWPWVKLTESPVETGTGSSTSGFGFIAGLYWFFYERFVVDLGYQYVKLDSNFSGTPTRVSPANTPGSSTSDVFQGFVITAGWQP
ncbi:MAG TPA: hypothetical protein VI895_09750 [Bdellovibrionota bacterium]|nr:hypothetical protein [Bdellovibrionota bacterium]